MYNVEREMFANTARKSVSGIARYQFKGFR